jgi:hypothetical protein
MNFSEYLSNAAPDNLDIETLNFWFSSQHNYPNLSKIAINFLCIPCGSCDAESSFSKLRDVNTIKRSRMSSDTLKMQMIMYFNGDIEEKLANY